MNFRYSILCLALALSSCTKDESELNNNLTPNGEELITISVSPNTKVSFEGSSDGLKLNWESDDAISIYSQNGASASQKWGDYDVVSIDETSGVATVKGPALQDGAEYIAVYPTSEKMSLEERNQEQYRTDNQLVDNSFDHLDDACKMKSNLFTKEENVNFAHEMAMLTISHTQQEIPMAIEVVVGSGSAEKRYYTGIDNGNEQSPIHEVNILIDPKLSSEPLTVNIYSQDNECHVLEKKSTLVDFVAGGHYTASVGDYLTLPTNYDKDNEIALLKQRIATSLVANNELNIFIGNLYNQMIDEGNEEAAKSLLSYMVPSDEKVIDIWNTLQEDGSFSTIDYTSQQASSWPLTAHFENCLVMARGYRNPHSHYFKDPAIVESIISAIKYWLAKKPYCKSNWFPNKIAVPRALAKVLILLDGEISYDLLKSCKFGVLNKAKIEMTGINRVELSTIVFMTSMLMKDTATMQKACNAINPELNVVAYGTEGLQSDYTYQQHGMQMQLGNYGLAYASTMAPWIAIVAGTSYDFEAEQKDALNGFLLNAINASLWRGAMDIHGLGRQISHNSQKSKAIATIAPINYMMQATPEKATEYQKLLDRNFKDAENDLVGNFYYPCSRYMVHRSKSASVNVRMMTDEIVGCEALNEENIEGYYLGAGSTFTYYGDDAYSNFFPYWDPCSIPGITAADDDIFKSPSTSNYFKQSASFAGGISDGEVGMAAMDYKRRNVKAKKSWFFLGEQVVCLGNSIDQTAGKPLHTTVEQNNSRNIYSYLDSETQSVGVKEQSVKTTKVYSDGVGYESLDSQPMDVKAYQSEGTWYNIGLNFSQDIVKGDIFLATITHDPTKSDNSYAYSIQPGVDKEQFFSNATAKEFVVTQNNSTASVVEYNAKQTTLAVFWKAGTIQTTMFGEVTASKPVVMMIKGAKEIPIATYDTISSDSPIITINGTEK